MHDSLDHLLGFAVEQPWALTAQMRSIVAGILARRIAGVPIDPQQVAAAEAIRTQRTLGAVKTSDKVAVIRIQGVIAPRMNLMTAMSGGATFKGLTAQLDAAVAKRPKAIVFDIDSPGGNVAGATEFARAVLKARASVPIIAQAEYLMASGAYWCGACATEVVASPSALIGSVGVYSMYDDISASLELLGIKREVIAAGKFKGEGADGGPLTEEARAYRKSVVDFFYAQFVTDLAKGRGVSAEAIRAGYGQGRVLTADDALAAGMITRIATLDDTLDRFGVARTPEDDADEDLAAATAQELRDAATAQERSAVIRDANAAAALQAKLAANIFS